MRLFDDPAQLTPDARLREVAIILAAGMLRLRARAALPILGPQNLADSGQDCLELPGETVLCVHTG